MKFNLCVKLFAFRPPTSMQVVMPAHVELIPASGPGPQQTGPPPPHSVGMPMPQPHNQPMLIVAPPATMPGPMPQRFRGPPPPGTNA